MRTTILILLMAVAAALRLPPSMPRRQIIGLGLGASTLATPLAPAFARSKSSTNPNKPEGVGANAKDYIMDQYKKDKLAMNGDKGSRGVASKEFEKSDTVALNRKKYDSLAYTADGKKIVNANRNRTPEELGLKQWSGK